MPRKFVRALAARTLVFICITILSIASMIASSAFAQSSSAEANPNWKPCVSRDVQSAVRIKACSDLLFWAMFFSHEDIPRVQLTQARAYLDSGTSYESAIEAYKGILKFKQTPAIQAEALMGIGVAYALQGNIALADSAFGAAEKLRPSDPKPQGLRLTLMLLRTDDPTLRARGAEMLRTLLDGEPVRSPGPPPTR